MRGEGCNWVLRLTLLTSFFFVGCAKEEGLDVTYKFIQKDTITVLSHKAYYFYPGTSIQSTNKGYVVVKRNMKKEIIPTITGFDSVYEEGYEYTIIVKIISPKKIMPDLYGDRYEFVSLISKKRITNYPPVKIS